MGGKTGREDSILDDDVPPTVFKPPAEKKKQDLVLASVLVFIYVHIFVFYGLYLALTSAMWQTICFTILNYAVSGLGTTMGAHRLWSHKAFKVKPSLEVVLMLWQSLSFQNTAIHWARDHQLHHKYTDTDADPHNSSRGLFFSHIGWLVVRKHPQVIEKGKLLDVTDFNNNPVLQFQERNKYWLLPTAAFILPTLIPIYCWNETLSNAWHLNITRYVIVLNMTLTLNSLSHKWGYRPYDGTLSATQNNFITMMTSGGGFHNYHHVFPWDYKSGEHGNYCFSAITWFIDVCAYFGLVYDLREASHQIVKTRAARTGDGSDLWGYRTKNHREDLEDL